MNTLPSCGSKMKRLIALVLLAPAFASATDPCPNEECGTFFITSGSGMIAFEDSEVIGYGPGFTTSASWGPGFAYFGPPGSQTITAGDPFDPFALSPLTCSGPSFGNCTPTLSAPNGPPPDYNGDIEIFGSVSHVTASGPNSGPFTYAGGFSADVGGGIEDHWSVFGEGTMVVHVSPTNTPGVLSLDSATFTFANAVPEPSTTSLLLLGFAALGFPAWTRRRREQR